MINEKEAGHILLSVIILGFVAAWVEFGYPSLENFLTASLYFIIIIFVSVGAKKWSAAHFDAKAEVSTWSFRRYWFRPGDQLKTSVPLGIIMPFVFAVLTLGRIPWYATLETDITSTKSRVSKRHGPLSFTELTDWDEAKIAASGIWAPIMFGLLALLLKEPTIAKLSIGFGMFNLLPLGHLDGCKVFFNERILWIAMAIISLMITLLITI